MSLRIRSAPSPLWGRVGGGSEATRSRRRHLRLRRVTSRPRPLSPPHKGEGSAASAELRRRSSRPRLPRTDCEKPRRRAGAFLLANGRGAQVDPASPLARAPFLAVAELAGSAATGRILLAAPITLAEIEARFAERIDTREEIAFDQATASLRARRQRRFGALALSEQPMPVSGERGRRARPGRRCRAARRRAVAVDQGPAAMARPGRISCAAPKATSGPICRTPRWPPMPTGLRRSLTARPRWPNSRRRT